MRAEERNQSHDLEHLVMVGIIAVAGFLLYGVWVLAWKYLISPLIKLEKPHGNA